jgi:hypothetical protein
VCIESEIGWQVKQEQRRAYIGSLPAFVGKGGTDVLTAKFLSGFLLLASTITCSSLTYALFSSPIRD